MGYWDIRLIGASNKKLEGDLAVHLYGKTLDGQSIAVKYTGFEPYFYFVEPDSKEALQEIVEMLSTDDRVKRLEDAELLYKGEMRKCKKVVATFPWLVPDIRKTIIPKTTVLAADIPFHFRFVYDMNIGSCDTNRAPGLPGALLVCLFVPTPCWAHSDISTTYTLRTRMW